MDKAEHPKAADKAKAEAVANFKASEAYRSFTRTHGREIADGTISTCICCCMKADKREECACPTCTAFQHRLKAWHGQRSRWHLREVVEPGVLHHRLPAPGTQPLQTRARPRGPPSASGALAKAQVQADVAVVKIKEKLSKADITTIDELETEFHNAIKLSSEFLTGDEKEDAQRNQKRGEA